MVNSGYRRGVRVRWCSRARGVWSFRASLVQRAAIPGVIRPTPGAGASGGRSSGTPPSDARSLRPTPSGSRVPGRRPRSVAAGRGPWSAPRARGSGRRRHRTPRPLLGSGRRPCGPSERRGRGRGVGPGEERDARVRGGTHGRSLRGLGRAALRLAPRRPGRTVAHAGRRATGSPSSPAPPVTAQSAGTRPVRRAGG